jgi:hypothetical protein
VTASATPSRLANIALLVCSILFSLILGEGLCRTFLPRASRPQPGARILGHLHHADPMIGWLLSSSPIQYEHRLVDSKGNVQYDVVYSIAGEQRRTSEHPPSAPLLIASGCSFTFGHGLNDQDTWPWLLQEELPEYHVANVGTMAYGTDQALMAAERLIQKNPGRTAAVVLGFADFQVERNRSTQAWAADIYPLSKPLYAVGPHGLEYKRQVRFWSWGPLTDHSQLFGHLANTLADKYFGIPTHDQALQVTLELITTFAQKMNGLGIKFAVVVLPFKGDQTSLSKSDQKFLVDGMQAAKIPVLVPQFPRLPDNSFDAPNFMVSVMDSHPNRAYNVVLTRQLKPFLVSAGMINDR